MLTVVSPVEMQKWIEESLAKRPDIGLKRAFMNIILEGHNPFDPRVRRKPKTAFVLCAALFTAAAVCFCYFNFVR
jgi:hypothetical protein